MYIKYVRSCNFTVYKYILSWDDALESYMSQLHFPLLKYIELLLVAKLQPET